MTSALVILAGFSNRKMIEKQKLVNQNSPPRIQREKMRRGVKVEGRRSHTKRRKKTQKVITKQASRMSSALVITARKNTKTKKLISSLKMISLNRVAEVQED